jgi:hypothetical protein
MNNYNYSIVALAIVCGIIIFLFVPNGNLYDYLKQKRLEYHYQQEFEKHKIVCSQCKGSGQYPTDVNKLMMDASLALYINHHLMVDKCTKCVKLDYGDGYEYCETVESKYQTLLKEYAAADPKIEIAACDKCMGMGEFTAQNPDGGYITQKEYDNKHRQ